MYKCKGGCHCGRVEIEVEVVIEAFDGQNWTESRSVFD